MTHFFPSDDPDELRIRWLNRYLTVQAKADTRMRTLLIQAAQDAYTQINALSTSTTFSARVRSAQLSLVVSIITEVFDELFKRSIPIISNGGKQAASAAVTAFTETDRDYLAAAFLNSGTSVDSVIASQRQQAMLGVVHTLSRINKTDQPLSARVYRTKRLANQWVKKEVNLGLLRNASAKDIAASVRRSIRPNVAGGVSYAALRLGRTEINNAFHATSIQLASDRPWVDGMRWNLSKVHEIEVGTNLEICEHYAATGVFTIEKVPVKPHPQCRCFVTPELEPFESFLTHLTAGQYTDWIRNVA